MTVVATFDAIGKSRRFSSGAVVLIASILAGFALFSLDASVERIFLIGGAALGVIALLIYPELALALYVVVGDIKGDERVSSLFPVDLTLAMAAILLGGIALNLLRKKRVAPMPSVYFLFIVLATMMIASLVYTPVPEAGAEKLARFLTVTGIVIVAPFFLLGSPQAMKRFLAGFSLLAYAICSY